MSVVDRALGESSDTAPPDMFWERYSDEGRSTSGTVHIEAGFRPTTPMLVTDHGEGVRSIRVTHPHAGISVWLVGSLDDLDRWCEGIKVTVARLREESTGDPL